MYTVKDNALMEYCTKGQLCEMNVDFTISAVHYLNAIHCVPQKLCPPKRQPF